MTVDYLGTRRPGGRVRHECEVPSGAIDGCFVWKAEIPLELHRRKIGAIASATTCSTPPPVSPVATSPVTS